MSRVWPDRVVEENNLEAQISTLRKAFGADRELIQTVAGRGYQFRSEEHTSELQSQSNLVCRLLLEKKNILIHRHSKRSLNALKLRVHIQFLSRSAVVLSSSFTLLLNRQSSLIQLTALSIFVSPLYS